MDNKKLPLFSHYKERRFNLNGNFYFSSFFFEIQFERHSSEKWKENKDVGMK